MTDTNAPLPGRPGGTSRPRDRAGILRRALDRIAPGRASRRFETLVQELSDAVWEMDPALTRIVFVSDRLTDLVRRSPAEMQRDRSMWMRDVVHPADHQAFADFMVRVRTVARPRSSIGRSAPPRRASSARRRCQPATGCATPSPAGAGSRTRRSSSTGTTASRSTARACLRDVTAEELATRAQGEAEQRFRTMVEHHLDLVLAGASHDGTAAPLLYLDVDTFKHVNGRFGHDADDELLKEVARRLRVAARASDLVVRLGGDEFVIVLGDVPAESAAAVAEGVARRVCQAFERPFDVGGGFTTSSSIGIGLFPADAHDAKEPAQLGRPGDVRLQAGRPRGLDVRLRRHARRVRRYTPPPWESPRHPPGGRSSPWPCCWERLPWSSS